MSVDRETAPDTGEPRDDRAGSARLTAGAQSAARHPQPVSGVTVLWYSIVAGLLVSWFFLAWLVLGLNPVDAAGESIGTAFALLLIVSIVGTVRRSRR